MGFGDYQTALAMRELIKEMVTLELDKQRPRYQMATVVSIDRMLRRCVVQFLGDPSTATVSMGGIQPSSIGQVVRVEGLQGDRFIADVMGAPFENLEERMVNLESDPSATANFALNGNFEAGRDAWNDFWSGGTPKPTVTIDSTPGNAYSGNNTAKFNLVGDDTHYITWQQDVQFVNPGEVIQISWREKATANNLAIESRLGAVFGPTAETANFFGAGSYPLELTSNVQVATTNYVLRRASVVVPTGHNFVRFHIRGYIIGGSTTPAGSGFFVDDFRLQRIILQGNPADPVVFGGTVQLLNVTWAEVGMTFPNAGQSLKGPGWTNLLQSIRATAAGLMGGGIRTVTSTGIGWSQRFIMIALGRASAGATAGHFDISMPPDGTVITGVAGAADKTVAGGLIPLGSWEALYYIPPYGSDQTSLPANFRVATYTGSYTVPNEWVLLAIRNGDTSMVQWVDGREQDYWRVPTFANGWLNYGTFSPAGYKRDNGIVYLRGLVKSGTVPSTVFTLPSGYWPEFAGLYDGVTNIITSGAASTGTAHTHGIPTPSSRIDITVAGAVVVNNSLAGNGYVSLDNISFPAGA